MIFRRTDADTQILQEARNFLTRTLEHAAKTEWPGAAAVAASQVWAGTLDNVHRRVLRDARTGTEVIHLTTGNRGFFTYPGPKDSPYFATTVNSYFRFFEHPGYSFDSMPPEIEESPLVNPAVLFDREGRRLSTAFLWYLAAASRMRQRVFPAKRVLEIGGGYGGLARIVKLMQPHVTYYLIDFPECLAFAYIFLRLNFPDARVHYVEDGAVPADGDFILLPTSHIDAARKLKGIDLVFNSQSLSEMSQTAFDYYLDLIENHLEPRYYYNINRYAEHEDGVRIRHRDERQVGDDICCNSAALGPHWTARHWACGPEDHHWAGIDRRQPHVLELLVERIPPNLRDQAQYKRQANALMKEASTSLTVNSHLHYLLWEANRLAPSEKSLNVYIDLLMAHNCVEATHYIRIRNRLLGRDDPIFRPRPFYEKPELDLLQLGSPS